MVAAIKLESVAAFVGIRNRKRDEVLRFAWRSGLTHTILTGDYLAVFPHQG
jgi:hypothetical protein